MWFCIFCFVFCFVVVVVVVFFYQYILVNHTLGARDFSSAVSGFCQVFIVTRVHARKTFGTQGTLT